MFLGRAWLLLENVIDVWSELSQWLSCNKHGILESNMFFLGGLGHAPLEKFEVCLEEISRILGHIWISFFFGQSFMLESVEIYFS